MCMLDCLLVSAIIFYMYKAKIWMGVVTSLQSAKWSHCKPPSSWFCVQLLMMWTLRFVWQDAQWPIMCSMNSCLFVVNNGFVPSVLWRCWLDGRKGIWPVKIGWWGVGVVICLEQCADLHMAQLMPLPLTVSCFSKTRFVLPFWYRLTRVVTDKWPLSRCVCVCCSEPWQCVLTQVHLNECMLVIVGGWSSQWRLSCCAFVWRIQQQDILSQHSISEVCYVEVACHWK